MSGSLHDHLSKFINISVECYDKEHLGYFSDSTRYPAEVISRVGGLKSSPFKLDVGEFLIYYLFHLKKNKPKTYRTRGDLSVKLSYALTTLEEWVVYTDSSLSVCDDADEIPVNVKEQIGEAVGMAVTAYLNNITNADWAIIPVLRVKALDFYLAGTSNGAIQLETKGSHVKNCNHKNGIYTHKANISAKKKTTKLNPIKKYPGDYLFGTISVIDNEPTRNVKCWLVDPEPQRFDYDKYKTRLLIRLKNALALLRLISPDSRLIALLKERIVLINGSSDYLQYNNISLDGTKPSEENLDVITNQFFYRKTYLRNPNQDKSEVESGVWGGAGNGRVYFVGAKRSLIKAVYSQHFEEIINFSCESEVVEYNFICSNSTEADADEFLSIHSDLKHLGDIHAIGNIYTSSSGMLFGIATLR